MMPLVPERKMADFGKLISLGNLLFKKVTWLTLILSRTFGVDCMTRIECIYSRLPRTHSLHSDLQSHHTLPLSHFHFQRKHTPSLLHFYFQPLTFLFCLFG